MYNNVTQYTSNASAEAIPSIITLVDHMTSLDFGRTLVGWTIYLSDKNLAWDIWRPNYRPSKYDHCSDIFKERTGSVLRLNCTEGTVYTVSFK